jgi:hypothetical protein
MAFVVWFVKIKQLKTMKTTNNTPETTKVNTMVDPDSIGRIEPTAPEKPVGFREIEEETILINPDMESMDSRG